MVLETVLSFGVLSCFYQIQNKSMAEKKHRVSVDLSDTTHERYRKLAFDKKSTVKKELEKEIEKKTKTLKK
jgi:hypothetical protein